MAHILDVDGDDIANLGDAELRTLVARLALAELASQGMPLSSVTSGGDQDAADGGLDVRVECPADFPTPDFVPRRMTGFQVKKPDMNASAIEKEMRPKGALRTSIATLAENGGAYIIISAQGSVADKPLKERRSAIRHALRDDTNADHLLTDFYDRTRLATWVNRYPGVRAWVRARVGRAVQGWSATGEWAGATINANVPFLTDERACMIDGSRSPPQPLTILSGIARLRELLGTPRQCVRLVGLSGTGKTRVVQALFEPEIGTNSLDPSIALYTDYGETPTPTAREMAQQLVNAGTRAILVVDNCNPETHSAVAKICAGEGSTVSLLTVEYDVADDEPEQTDVFRLQSASNSLLVDWLSRMYPDLSQVDAGTIASFSEGNFRVAGTLASTVKKGETLGSLRSRELFDRLFQQRQGEDPDLRSAAEDLALLYSIDGLDTSDDGELAKVASLRQVKPTALYAALAALAKRGIVQARGRWRAILPPAIANRLASDALTRIAPAEIDAFAASLAPRMLRSFVRRVGYLHDRPEARALLLRWMAPGGYLEGLRKFNHDGLVLLSALSPIAPTVVLDRIKKAFYADPLDIDADCDVYGQWTHLIHALAYEATDFETAAQLLGNFLAAETSEKRHDSATNAFAELFHMHLSCTRATPAQRRSLIRHFSESKTASVAGVALDALFEVESHTSFSWPSFGARPRDWGWWPESEAEQTEWMTEAIALARELESEPVGGKRILAKRLGEIWRFPGCRSTFEASAKVFAVEEPWIEGWLSARRLVQWSQRIGQTADGTLKELVAALAPTDLLSQAKAIVMNGSATFGEFTDGEPDGEEGQPDQWERADDAARTIGRALAINDATRARFVPWLIHAVDTTRGFACGQGMADGARAPGLLWKELVSHYQSQSQPWDVSILVGFIASWRTLDAQATDSALTELAEDAQLAALLPSLEGIIQLGSEGVRRLLTALANGYLGPSEFRVLATGGAVRDTSPESLGALLQAVGALPGGAWIALDIFHARLWHHRQQKTAVDVAIVKAGRAILQKLEFSLIDVMRDHHLKLVIEVCCVGEDGISCAKTVSTSIRDAFNAHRISPYQLTALPALFLAQPETALDTFLLALGDSPARPVWRADRELGPALEAVGGEKLIAWARRDPDIRFGMLGTNMSLFTSRHPGDDGSLSATFLEVLATAPDADAFLGEARHRLLPSGWSGSLAMVIEYRIEKLKSLPSAPAPLLAWLEKNADDLDRWIESERKRDREDEQYFE